MGDCRLPARSDLIQYQFQRDYSSHRVELGLDGITVRCGEANLLQGSMWNDDNLHQTGGHEEMRKGKTPEHSRGFLALGL